MLLTGLVIQLLLDLVLLLSDLVQVWLVFQVLVELLSDLVQVWLVFQVLVELLLDLVQLSLVSK